MIGIALAALAVVWLFVTLKLTMLIAGLLKSEAAQWVFGLVALAVLLPLPLVDELFAQHQINALCREGAVLKIGEHGIKGRTVKVSAEPLHAEVPGVAIPVTYSKHVFRDSDTGEELGSLGWYNIKGGWLIRALGASESNSPLTTESYCSPGEGTHEAAKRLDFKIIN